MNNSNYKSQRYDGQSSGDDDLPELFKQRCKKKKIKIKIKKNKKKLILNKVQNSKKINNNINMNINMNVFKINNNKSTFDKRITRIKVNINDINKIIDSGWDRHYSDSPEWCKTHGIPTTTLSAVQHLKMIKNNIRGDKLKCELFKTNIGRAYYKGAISLGSLPRDLRQAISVNHTIDKGNTYKQTQSIFDYDLDNAHNNILLQLCKQSHINIKQYSFLSDYCINREDWLQEISKNLFKSNCNNNDKDKRNQAKTLMLKALNQGHIDNSIDDDIDINNKTLLKIRKFQHQIKKIFIKIKEVNPDFYEECLDKKENNKNNAFRSFVARTLQHFEFKIVEHVITQLENNKIIIKNRFDYQFDGFQIEKEIDIKLLEKYTKEFGFDLKWSIKKSKEAKKIWREVYTCIDENKETIIHPEQYTETMNESYFKSLIGNYPKMRDYFELFYTFVKNPQPLFYYSRIKTFNNSENGKITKQRLISPLSEELVIKQYKRFHSHIEKTRYGEKKISFMKTYLTDIDAVVKEEMDFYPVNSNKPNNKSSDIYNTFTGYNDDCFEPNIQYDPKSIQRGGILYNYLQVVKNVVGGEKEREVFLQLIADKIANPNNKRPFAILIKGDQGVGKNTILEQLAKIIGFHHYYSTANIKDITSDHAEGLMNKLIVNLNEINFNDTKDKKELIKSIISESRMTFNIKYARPVTQNVYALIIATTNTSGSIPLDISSGERRWFVFESNKNNKKLLKERNGQRGWDRVHAQWEKKEFIQQLYLYLMTLVYKQPNYNFQKVQREMTKTKPYRNLCMFFIPSIALMLKDYIIQKKFVDYKIKDDLDDELYYENKKEEEQVYYYQEDSFKTRHTISLKDLIVYYKDWYREFGGLEKYKADNKRVKNAIMNLNISSMSEEQMSGNLKGISFKPMSVILDFINRNFWWEDTNKWGIDINNIDSSQDNYDTYDDEFD